jgi:hypothetical protein
MAFDGKLLSGVTVLMAVVEAADSASLGTDWPLRTMRQPISKDWSAQVIGFLVAIDRFLVPNLPVPERYCRCTRLSQCHFCEPRAVQFGRRC